MMSTTKFGALFNRSAIADAARARWSLEACAKRYDKAFRQLNGLYHQAWYELGRSS
jgi:hypothetical protein